MTRQNMAWHGTPKYGMARQNMTWHGTGPPWIMHVLVSRVMSTSNLAEEAVIDAGALHADNRLPPTAQDNQGKEMQQTLSPTPSTASPT